MKREIKFRAWTGEEMIYFGNGMKHRYDFENGYVFAFSGEEYSGFSLHEMFDDESEFEVMQYTGLKDKNSKEIYEGDIISIRPRGANYPINYVVVFNHDELGFRIRFIDRYINNESGFYDEKIKESSYDVFEVIGNIYQNRELLK